MTILDKIIANKQQEVAADKAKVSIQQLQMSGFYAKTTNSLKLSLSHPASSGIIAEYKRKSPSKGIINDTLTPAQVTTGYVQAGAACLSVLTDTEFFGGTKADFEQARLANPTIPMLRKDFMINPYQIHEAKAMGADVILLIAANLSPAQIANLSLLAHQIGLETLLEIHDEAELNASPLAHIDVIGVNNRNLKNFAEQNVHASLDLANKIPSHIIKISESCISDPKTVQQLKQHGYKGFLIGENFMKTPNPGQALATFISDVNA